MAESNTMSSNRNYLFPLIIIGAFFFIFGFTTWANSQLIPYLKIACELTTSQSLLVTMAFFAAYFVMALPSSYILNKIGYKKGMILGLAIMAAGALVFIPAGQSRSYPMFLTGLFIIATGLALLQTASNPYVTVLGPMESAAKRISIMGICNKAAGFVAVMVMGKIILKDVDALEARLATLQPIQRIAELDALAKKVINPYITIAVILVVFAIILAFLHLPEIREQEETESDLAKNKTSIFQFPHLILGAFAIFFYVGAEVISYDTFAGFGKAQGYSTEKAAGFAKFTAYGLLLGYLLNIVAIPKYFSQRAVLIFNSILSIILVLIAIFTQGTVAIAAFAILGFSQAIMWPAIWPLAIDGLGRFTKTGAAFLIMGIVGGAIIPYLYGLLSEQINSIQKAYLIMIPCYLFVLYFGVSGYRVGRNRSSHLK
jgi:FHS family L-fucose permease-like MFS transporter